MLDRLGGERFETFQEGVEEQKATIVQRRAPRPEPCLSTGRFEQNASVLHRGPWGLSQRLLWPFVFGSSATTKRGQLLLCIMLVEEQGWLMPLLFLSCGLWAVSPMLKIHEPQHRLYRQLVHAIPLVVLFMMLTDRASDLLAHTATHPEVATLLSSSDGTTARFQVLFTGQGAVEGAMLSFLMFSVLSPNLPSLRTTSDETKQAVQRRMVAHAGVWSMGLLALLLPEQHYQSMAVLPNAPTQPLASWSVLGLVFLITLVLIMAGEITASTGVLPTSREPSLLLRRALMKMAVALPLAWGLWASTGVELNEWWQRPDDHRWWGAGMMVLMFGTLTTAVHAPALMMEGRWHTHQHPTSTLLVTLIASVAVMTLLAWLVADEVGFRTSADGGWVSLRLTGTWLLVAGACMTLPTLGLDAAHRPELWWYRMVLCGAIPVGLLFTEDMVLVAQGVLVAGTLSLLWPWAIEHVNGSSARFGVSVTMLVVILFSLILTLSSISWPRVMAAQAVVSLATAGGLLWSTRLGPSTS